LYKRAKTRQRANEPEKCVAEQRVIGAFNENMYRIAQNSSSD
jgi:hypothetical protein